MVCVCVCVVCSFLRDVQGQRRRTLTGRKNGSQLERRKENEARKGIPSCIYSEKERERERERETDVRVGRGEVVSVLADVGRTRITAACAEDTGQFSLSLCLFLVVSLGSFSYSSPHDDSRHTHKHTQTLNVHSSTSSFLPSRRTYLIPLFRLVPPTMAAGCSACANYGTAGT